MKKLITILVIAAMLLSANVSYGQPLQHYQDGVEDGFSAAIALLDSLDGLGGEGGNANIGDIDASSEQDQAQFQDQLQGQSQVNEGNTNEINIDNTTTIPAPIMPVPGFIAPVDKTVLDQSWTNNPFDLGKTNFTIAQLTRLANPSRALGLLWPEWDKDFKVEIACWHRAKSTKSIRIYSYDRKGLSINIDGCTKMGEAHAKAKQLHKSEKQVVAALCVYAAKQGARVVVIKSFSNPVTKADSAVLGGAGTSVTGTGDIVNSAGGFGWTTAEKVYRSYVVAELYR